MAVPQVRAIAAIALQAAIWNVINGYDVYHLDNAAATIWPL